MKYKSECLLTVLCAHKTRYLTGEKKETECLGMGSKVKYLNLSSLV